MICHREIAQACQYLTVIEKIFKDTSKRMEQLHQKRVCKARSQQMRIRNIFDSSQCSYLVLAAT